MRIALIHGHAVGREVIQRGLRAKLAEEVIEFNSNQDFFASSQQFDVVIVYSDLGHKGSGIAGVQKIRTTLPDAAIIGVSNKPYSDHPFLAAGADAFLLRSGNEISELVDLIRKKLEQKNAELPAEPDTIE